MIQPLGINSHLNPVNTQWARHAMSDAALFHGVLFHASVHVESYGGQPWSPETLFHRGETIRLTSERLNNPNGIVSDDTIAAVGWVASEGVSLSINSCCESMAD
jgi:Fungal specific transcription factor domain